MHATTSSYGLASVAALRIGHAGYNARYSLPLVLGIALAGPCLLRLIRRRYLLLSLVGFLLLAGVANEEVHFWQGDTDHFIRLSNATDSLQVAARSVGHENLPVVLSDGLECLQETYYAGPELARRIVSVVDVPQAILYAGTDVADEQLPTLASFYPLHVYQFSAFAQNHPTFLLYSSGVPDWDWWPRRLKHDGYSLQILYSGGPRKMYLVERGESMR